MIHILSLSNSHSNVVSIQKNRGDKSHRVIVALIGLGFFKCLGWGGGGGGAVSAPHYLCRLWTYRNEILHRDRQSKHQLKYEKNAIKLMTS